MKNGVAHMKKRLTYLLGDEGLNPKKMGGRAKTQWGEAQTSEKVTHARRANIGAKKGNAERSIFV
jgi:hypothetical protein